MSRPQVAFDLLRPRLPSRRTRMASVLAGAVLGVALLDLLAVLLWSALAVQTTRIEGIIHAYRQREAQANALAVRGGVTARQLGDLRARLELLRALPPGRTGSETLMTAIRQALPAGAELTEVTLDADRHVTLAGVVPSYAAVEAYTKALEATGQFAYVRVVSSAARQAGVAQAASAPATGTGAPAGAGVAGSPSGPGGVQFQLEAWLRGEGTG